MYAVIDENGSIPYGALGLEADLDSTGCVGLGGISRSSSFRNSFRRSRKEPIWIQNIRQQLSEQLKCLDIRVESHASMLWELQDFYRRRAELELEYSKSLDRLVKQIMMRHKQEKTKRELWPGFSTYTCWQYLLSSTKRASRDHATLYEIYSGQMVNRFADTADDMQRIYKKCRDIGSDSHEEILKVLNELQSAMKTYHMYHGESKQAEAKLKEAQTSKSKVELTPKGTLSKKFRNYEKQETKRQVKYQESKMKALKVRNEYLLCLDSTNASIHKYFVEDLHNLIDCMDCGYHNAVQRSLMTHISAEENVMKAKQGCVDLLNKSISDLDQRADKQKFLENFNQGFALPKKFEFQAHKGDEVCQISAQKPVQDELLDRLKQINNRLNKLKLENDEVWKTLETAENSLMVMINQKDYDVSTLFTEELRPPKSPHEHYKKRSDRMETEAFYIDKFKDFTFGSNLIARLQAKSVAITKALGDGGGGGSPGGGNVPGNIVRPPSLPPKPKKRRIGKAPLVGQPKLFGGSIEEYVDATKNEIPIVVDSCVRVINLYGFHHQGVFRVSGSQHEINEFRNSYERGEDPLLGTQDGRDINSIAGVLKLYFRELKEPLFPTQYFDELVSYSQLESTSECVRKVKELIQSLPRPIFIVMRYLFSFLNHLAEYSDENMMDAYNLGVCFGPTLLPIPPDRDQVIFQGNVNDLMKTIVMHQEEIFPNDGGCVYEKCIVEDDVDTGDSLDNLSDEEGEMDDNISEEDIFMEVEEKEAVAQYDFIGRTNRELTFKKGARLVVYTQVSPDWWEGSLNGKEGLVPDKYIALVREGDDQSCGEEDKRRSTESLPAKPFGLTPLSDEDKSASQPNIAIPPPSSHSHLGLSRATRLSTTSTDSSKSHKSASSTGSSAGSESPTGSLHSLTSKDSAYSMSSKETLDELDENDENRVSEELDLDVNVPTTRLVEAESSDSGHIVGTTKSTEDLQNDIDSALAEVMSGLQSLEMQQHSDNLTQPKMSPPLTLMHVSAKHTPDLVLDLPINNEPISPKDQGSPVSGKAGSGGSGGSSSSGSDADIPLLSTAEMFAKSNQSTIKKGQSMTMPKAMSSSFTAAGGTNTLPQPSYARVQEMSQFSPSAMKRSTSSNEAMQKRKREQASPANRSERYSDPPHQREPTASEETMPEQVWQPQSAQIIKATGAQHQAERAVTPERSATPERPSLPSKPRPSPDRQAAKPAPPPLKMKPTVKAKPAVLQRLREGTLGSMDSNV